jgi:hypothetical protein
MNRKQKVLMFLVAVIALLFIAGDHPLVDHWGDVASSGTGDFGSKWIHTATSGVRYGLWGESASTDARGVFGRASTTTGSGLAIGVYGETDSPTGRGVHGYNTSGTGANYGVTGSTYSTNALAAGVFGFNNRTSGSTRGVQGIVKSRDGFGVIGFLNPNSGDGNGAGVFGSNSATSGTGSGVEGYNSSSNGWAGYFTSVSNGVKIVASAGSTGLVVTGGSKSAAFPTTDGDRLLYNEESTEVWFSDYGFGHLEHGYARVNIDPTFAETVSLNSPYHVFLQAYGDADLYVGKRTSDYFEVLVIGETKDVTLEFSYRIVAKRLGFEEERLEFAPWVTDEQPFDTPRLPPEPPPLISEPVEVLP